MKIEKLDISKLAFYYPKIIETRKIVASAIIISHYYLASI